MEQWSNALPYHNHEGVVRSMVSNQKRLDLTDTQPRDVVLMVLEILRAQQMHVLNRTKTMIMNLTIVTDTEERFTKDLESKWLQLLKESPDQETALTGFTAHVTDLLNAGHPKQY